MIPFRRCRSMTGHPGRRSPGHDELTLAHCHPGLPCDLLAPTFSVNRDHVDLPATALIVLSIIRVVEVEVESQPTTFDRRDRGPSFNLDGQQCHVVVPLKQRETEART